MNILEQAKRLRDMAGELEQLVFDGIPKQHIDLVSAANSIRTVVGDSANVQMNIWPAHKPPVTFDIWDGKKHYSSPDLATAVDDCLEHHRKAAKVPPETTIEQADAMLAAAQPAGF